MLVKDVWTVLFFVFAETMSSRFFFCIIHLHTRIIKNVKVMQSMIICIK